jgi:hypothetical protein
MGHWICEVCKGEIDENNRGGIIIYNTNPSYGPVGSGPIGPTVEPEEPAELVLPSEEGWNYLRARHEAVSIGFSVAHRKCERNESEGPYFIDAERAPTLEAWVTWVLHMQEKAWMGRDDLMRMLGFWWSHKGAVPPLY